jgi:hypothetical protein
MYGMTASDEDRDRSRRLGAEYQKWSSTGWVLGGRTIERSGDAVCSLYRAQGDEEREFLSLASKPRSTVSSGRFGLKTILVVWPQNHLLGFSGLGLKTAAAV